MGSYQHISLEKDTSVLVVDLLDQDITSDQTAEGLRRELYLALDTVPSRKVAVNFRRVDQFSSIGFRPFLSLYRKLQVGKGRIVFFGVPGHLEQIFETTRLVSRARGPAIPFELAQDRDEAVGRLKYHRQRVEGNALVVTLAEPHLQGDPLADELSEELLFTIKEHHQAHVILDFGRVESLSSACIRPFLQVRTFLKTKAGQVIFCHLAPHIAEALLATRLIAANHSPAMPFGWNSTLDEAILQANGGRHCTNS